MQAGRSGEPEMMVVSEDYEKDTMPLNMIDLPEMVISQR